MSKRSSDQPTAGPRRPARPSAGCPPLQSLLRFDKEDDPDRAVPLYEAVVHQETARLTDHGWLDRLDAIGRLKCRLAALEAETIAGFDDSLRGVSADLGHQHPEPGDRAATAGERRWIAGDLRSVADEVAGILEMRRGSATTRIHRSCELVHNFPATLAALSTGLLTERAAFTIVSELSVLDDLDDLRAAEAAILDWARTHPLADIKQACQREVARRSPAATEKAYQSAHDERSVQMHTDDIGRAHLVHDHDAVDSAAVMTSLSRAAVDLRRRGDNRTLDQLRNDIALSRLLPRTKRPNPTPPEADPPTTNAPADNTHPEPHANHAASSNTGNAPNANGGTQTADGAHVAGGAQAGNGARGGGGTHVGNAAYGDGNGGAAYGDGNGGAADFGHGPGSDRGSSPDCDLSSDRDVMGETVVGADSTVVIHATGAEVRALISGEAATGGEADHHGPIAQSSLRKHLLRALAQTLLPNLPTTPNGSCRPGAAIHRARTGTPEARTPNTDSGTTPAAVSRGGGSRIELQITDQPPPSDPDRYTPSPALDRHVRLRDRSCQFPGCNRPAEFTDVDHRIAFAAGGRTTAANLWCLCRHHHRLKHEGGWHIHPNLDGTYTWISPIGRNYPNNRTQPIDDQ
jgi:hypothetical protein